MYKGTLYHKLKNSKGRGKKTVAQNDQSGETEESLKAFFKYCVVHNDKEKLKEKLSGTVELRRKLLKEKKEDFMEFLQFYFIDIDLVSH